VLQAGHLASSVVARGNIEGGGADGGWVARTPYVRACISPSFVLRLHGHSAATRSRSCGLHLAFVHARLHSFVPNRLFGLRLGSFMLNHALLGFSGALCVLSSLLYQMQT